MFQKADRNSSMIEPWVPDDPAEYPTDRSSPAMNHREL